MYLQWTRFAADSGFTTSKIRITRNGILFWILNGPCYIAYIECYILTMEISDRSLKKIRWQKMLNTLRKWLLILPRNGFEKWVVKKDSLFSSQKNFNFQYLTGNASQQWTACCKWSKSNRIFDKEFKQTSVLRISTRPFGFILPFQVCK